MVEALVNFFRNIIPGELTVFVLSMMPIIELRGGLVAAKMLGVDLLPAMLICFIGTILPTPFILLFINKIFDWMRNTRFVKLVDRMEAKANKMLDEANAMAELNNSQEDTDVDALAAKYDEQPANTAVDDELAALKAKMGLN